MIAVLFIFIFEIIQYKFPAVVYAEKTCAPQKGDDLLAQKAEFMRIYALRACQWHYYHTLGYKKGKFNSNPLWCQKWHDYEQAARLVAKKRWREMLSHTL